MKLYYQIKKMGGESSTIQEQSQKKADRIREELHLRINDFRRHYQEEFISIGQAKKNKIKRATASELTELMDEGEVSSYEVTLTFIQRAATIGVRNNYVIEEMFEQAVQRAKQCDKIRKANPGKKCWRMGKNKQQSLPPFLGVPISIKDNILYPGKISYIGHVDPINPIPQHPSELIILVKNMGFLPFVKSSSPQANKTIETNNNILGYAKNPWDETRTCGGSSGGQGGLIGSHCSPIGLGSDIAGSGRTPSEFNGLVTLKPYYRYSNLGNASSGGFSAGLFLRPETTVMSRSVEDVIIFNQFMYDKENYVNIPRKLKDPYLRLTPFNNLVFTEKKKLKIGYFTEFKGYLKCSPSHRRAVLQTLKIAQENGHNTEEIQIKEGQSMLLTMIRLWFSSPQLELLNELRKGQKPIPEYEAAYQLAKVPTLLKKALANVLSMSQPRLAALIRCSIPYDIKEYFTILYDFNEIRKELYAYLKSKEIDLIVCPGTFIPPFRLGTANKFSYCSTFTMIWSILFYAAGALPITTVRPEQQYFEDFYNDEIFNSISESMKGTAGLPIGIQVASYPGKEEQVLAFMKVVEQKVKFRQNHQSKAFHLVE